jgi:hypothetical protein
MSRPQGHRAYERVRSTEKSNNLIGIPTRDLQTCHMSTKSRIFLKPEVMLQPRPTSSATRTTQQPTAPSQGLRDSWACEPSSLGSQDLGREIRGLLLLAHGAGSCRDPGDGTARRRRQVQRDCLEGNQADTTFKFTERLLHACSELRLQENSKRVHSVLLLSAESRKRTGRLSMVTGAECSQNSCPLLIFLLHGLQHLVPSWGYSSLNTLAYFTTDVLSCLKLLFHFVSTSSLSAVVNHSLHLLAFPFSHTF